MSGDTCNCAPWWAGGSSGCPLHDPDYGTASAGESGTAEPDPLIVACPLPFHAHGLVNDVPLGGVGSPCSVSGGGESITWHFHPERIAAAVPLTKDGDK